MSSAFHRVRTSIERAIVDRALRDPEFRRRLVDESREAIEEDLGVSLPERMRVIVVEEAPDLMCLVLPVDLSGISEAAAWAASGDAPPANGRAPSGGGRR
jgi:hypothetical protein